MAAKARAVKNVNTIADSIVDQHTVLSMGSKSRSGSRSAAEPGFIRSSSSSQPSLHKGGKKGAKQLTYRNPMARKNKANGSIDSTPPPSAAAQTAATAVEEMDKDIDALLKEVAAIQDEDDEDLSNLKVAQNASDANSFGRYSIDLDGMDPDGLADIKSIFDTVDIDASKFKPKEDKKAASAPSSAPAPAPNPSGGAAPVPGGAPRPAPVPGSAPAPAPVPGGAPIPAAAPAPAPVAYAVSAAPISGVNVADVKSQFANPNAVPLLATGQAQAEFARPDEYDKTADVAYDKHAMLQANAAQAQQLAGAGKVSQFSGLQSTRNVVSTTAQDAEHLKKAKGKVTKFAGLEASTRKIVTADEEEQKRILESKLVQKQKSMFKNMGKNEHVRKETVMDKNVTDAAAAAKNVFKAMEKQTTKQNVNGTKRKSMKGAPSKKKL